MEGSESGDRGDQGTAPPPPDQPRLISLVAVAGAVIVIGLVSFALYRRSHQAPQVAEPVQAGGGEAAGQDAGAAGTPVAGTPIAAPIPIRLSPEASIAAERYRCICSCNDPLNVCTCTRTPGSRDMKTYVQELVNQKKSGKEIDAAMIARYGAGVLQSNAPPPVVPDAKKR